LRDQGGILPPSDTVFHYTRSKPRPARNFAPGFSRPAHENKTDGTRAGDEGGERVPAVFFIRSFLFCAGDKCALVPLNTGCVSNGLRFCELCENVNNFY
jgi:hypothetical protein